MVRAGPHSGGPHMAPSRWGEGFKRDEKYLPREEAAKGLVVYPLGYAQVHSG